MKYTYSLIRSIKPYVNIIMFLLCLVSYSCGGSDDGISDPPEIPELIRPPTLMTRQTIGELSTMESFCPLYGHQKI